MTQDSRNPHEPWLRGTLSEIPAVPRAVLHALELAKEDIDRWTIGLTDDELNQSPLGIPSIAFHVRHIVRSVDRLLTYAEGKALSTDQIALLRTELTEIANREELFGEFQDSLERSASRVCQLAELDFNASRQVGSRQLPTTLGGLFVHIADHTQRHVGQAITTAKIIVAHRTA